jgi:hypothetical protein
VAPSPPLTDPPEPILIDCEGAGCPPAGRIEVAGMCSMCGGFDFMLPDGTMPPHQRQDIIAMIARGDFDG